MLSENDELEYDFRPLTQFLITLGDDALAVGNASGDTDAVALRLADGNR